jgi:hypothetical protein
MSHSSYTVDVYDGVADAAARSPGKEEARVQQPSHINRKFTKSLVRDPRRHNQGMLGEAEQQRSMNLSQLEP